MTPQISEAFTSDERAVAGFRSEVKATLQEARTKLPALTEAAIAGIGQRLARDYSRDLIEDALTAANKERESRTSTELDDEIAVYGAALRPVE